MENRRIWNTNITRLQQNSSNVQKSLWISAESETLSFIQFTEIYRRYTVFLDIKFLKIVYNKQLRRIVIPVHFIGLTLIWRQEMSLWIMTNKKNEIGFPERGCLSHFFCKLRLWKNRENPRAGCIAAYQSAGSLWSIKFNRRRCPAWAQR